MGGEGAGGPGLHSLHLSPNDSSTPIPPISPKVGSGVPPPRPVNWLKASMASLPLLSAGDTPDPFVPFSLLLESLPRGQCWLSLPPDFLVVHKVSWLLL